ncbi:DUF6114 domain-containing protein [Streptomyces olivoreticuli]|uniref:DUF6114 domain-containing protein n=1 Tax=Streptomyces olivoreticuli TaxID=68246 RepID=UPI002658E3C3|nr:DUF6114 domain-containing protein [Streptomyces olivoreticuli]WKK22167.1 DUF6114 domain-containing protein [Streptomyces olivoreticuli]
MAAGIESGRPRRHPWAAWRQWRKGRPFWGGLASVLAGAEICAIPLAPLKVMLHQGIAGIPSVLMGLVMILMGLSAWFAPQYRTLAGIVTVMVAAATLVMSNLGGFLIGTLMGVVGGAMVFAWQPLPQPADAGERPMGEPGAPGGSPAAGGPAPDAPATPPPGTPPPPPPNPPGTGPQDTAPRPPAGPSAEIGPWTPAQQPPRSGPVRDVDHQPRPHLPHQRSSDDRS